MESLWRIKRFSFVPFATGFRVLIGKRIEVCDFCSEKIRYMGEFDTRQLDGESQCAILPAGRGHLFLCVM